MTERVSITEANKAIFKRFSEESWNRGNLDVIDELVDPNFIGNFPAPNQPLRGPEGLKQYYKMYMAGFSDIHFTVEEQIAEGDTVVMRWSVRATHTGELTGIPPTNKTITSAGMTLCRFADGKMMEWHGHWDMLGMLQQLGVIPSLELAGT